jgi:hypothetical protein
VTCHADGEGKGGLKLLGDGNEEAMHMFCASLTGSSFLCHYRWPAVVSVMELLATMHRKQNKEHRITNYTAAMRSELVNLLLAK